MSELKDYRIPTRSGNVCHCYPKYEADKVIAEKDKEIAEQESEIAELKEQVHEYAQYLYVIQARAEKEARHDKYKRCMAMAKWCECKRIDAEDDRIPRKKWDFYGKWHKCWLIIAEKFKGA